MSQSQGLYSFSVYVFLWSAWPFHHTVAPLITFASLESTGRWVWGHSFPRRSLELVRQNGPRTNSVFTRSWCSLLAMRADNAVVWPKLGFSAEAPCSGHIQINQSEWTFCAGLGSLLCSRWQNGKLSIHVGHQLVVSSYLLLEKHESKDTSC